MTLEPSYKDKLNNMDFEQLIMERENLVGDLYDLECDIREGFIEDEFSSLLDDPDHYKATLQSLAMLSTQMSQRIPEFIAKWQRFE